MLNNKNNILNALEGSSPVSPLSQFGIDPLTPTIPLQLMEFLEIKMVPHEKYFNIIEITEIIDDYLEKHTRRLKDTNQQNRQTIEKSQLNMDLNLTKKLSEFIPSIEENQIMQDQMCQRLMKQIKKIFVYMGLTTINYRLINQYIYNKQLRVLQIQAKDQDYMQIGQKRVRLDQNLKICIMPQRGESLDDLPQNTKIKELVFKENETGRELQSIYCVTKDYVKRMHIKPQLIGSKPDFDRTGDGNCWYHYLDECIRPKKNVLSVNIKAEHQLVPLKSQELKKMRASSATNLEEMVPSHNLNILKASVGKNMIGFLTLDQSFLVEPIPNKFQSRINQGYIGNLLRDIPPQLQVKGGRQKYQEVLLFTNYGDGQWIILTTKFLYFYRIPLPSDNLIINDQNNLLKASSHRPNPLLILCQRLPKDCLRAVPLLRPYIALMLKSSLIVIIKLIINQNQIILDRQKIKRLALECNYYKVTNKIHNDVQFKSLCFHSRCSFLFFSDYGAYLSKVAFNPHFGDAQEEGISYSNKKSVQLSDQMNQNSFIQLKKSRSKLLYTSVIREVDEQSYPIDDEALVEVQYLKKQQPSKQLMHLSVHQKQTKSPYTTIIKNNTRQIISLMTTNPHYSTLITYESQSYQKKTKSEYEGDKYKQWGNHNKIKLWDIHHMTVYQIVDVSIQIGFMQLRSNGIYTVTTQKGYLGFYPLNQDQKIILNRDQQQALDKESKQVIQELSDELMMQNNTLYFSSNTSKFNKFNHLKLNNTNLFSLEFTIKPVISLLQNLPSDTTGMAINNRIYILQNSSLGLQACNLHIYNKMGVKQQVKKFSNGQEVDAATGKLNDQYNQQYKYLKRVNHKQFQVVVWNADSLKLLGENPEESYTIVWHSARMNQHSQTTEDGLQKTYSIRNIEVNGNCLTIHSQTTTRILNRATSGITSQSRKDLPDRPPKRKHKSAHFQHVYHSLILVDTQTDRITYKLQHINIKVKVLHVYNSLIITKEQWANNSEYEVVKILDVAIHGDPNQKVLFAVKYKKIETEKIVAGSLKKEGYYEPQANKNQIVQQIRQYIQRKTVVLQESKILISSNNKLILMLIFKVETSWLQIVSKKLLKYELDYMVYIRNITSQLLNKNYKVNKLNIGKVAKKSVYQYQATTGRTQNIIGHKVVTYQNLNVISNYTQINMEGVCESAHQSNRYQIDLVDLTSKILKPRSIGDSRTQDLYMLLSLKNDPWIFPMYEASKNKQAIVNNFSIKIVDFNQDNLKGTITLSNRYLRTISVHNIAIDCIKEQIANQVDPYRLDLKLNKIAVLRVRSQRQMYWLNKKRKSQDRMPSNKGENVIQILDWNQNYKNQVEKMWQDTFKDIKEFIKNQKQSTKKINQKQKEYIPELNSPVVVKVYSPHQVKVENIRERKSISQRKIEQQVQLQKSLQGANGEGFSKMFKKWSIGQAIALQKKQQDLEKNTQMRRVNRYINKILNSEDDKSARVNQLIKSTKRIKEVSNMQISIDKYARKQEHNNMKNIYETYQIAKCSNIKHFLQQKQNLGKTVNSQYNPESQKLSRSQTNKSSSLQEDLRLSSQSKDIRTTNQSKISLRNAHSNTQKRSLTQDVVDPNSFQQKIKRKLDEIHSNLNKQKSVEKVKNLRALQRHGGNFDEIRKTALKSKTQMSIYDKVSPPPSPSKTKTIKFITETKEYWNDSPIKAKNSESTNLFSPYANFSPLQRQGSQRNPEIPSLTKGKSTKYESQNDEIAQISLLKLTEVSPMSKIKSLRMKTEAIQRPDYALQQLKKSQIVLKDLVLPEIKVNKEKLMKKMKQKKSYIKTLHDHLNQASLIQMKSGQERKKLIDKLCEFK